VRHGSHRHLVRLPARGHPPGRGDAGQGARRRRADRRLPDAGKAKGLFKPGNHGSTFGGNPLATTAALTTIEVIENDRLIDNAVIVGASDPRRVWRRRWPAARGVVDIRGQGLMIGIELDRPCGELVTRGLDRGLLINVTADKVVRLLPALTFRRRRSAELVSRLGEVIKEFLAA
jgi:acetylornithine/N-succinyldiaminopimelate aminotransferase